MREAIGTSYIVNFIIVFFALFIFIFVGTLSYTKAFKVKNKIVDIIEKYDGKVASASGNLKSNVRNDIEKKLKQIGYRVSAENECETDGRFEGSTELTVDGSSYRYCVYKFNTSKGNYYGVVAYIYFEIPIIGAKLEFPVYGETKIFYELEN